MRNDLRRYISAVIAEAAVTPKAAYDMQLALYMMHVEHTSYYVLYQPLSILERLTAIVREIANSGQEHELSRLEGYDDAPITEDDVVGFIGVLRSDKRAGPCWGADVIKMSAAKKGFGPLLYDIAMAESPSGMLAPDRTSVTPAAASVWRHYLDRSDVATRRFDDIDDPKTPPREDDCKMFGREELDRAYIMSGAGPDVSTLKRRHRTLFPLIKKIASDAGVQLIGLDASDVEMALERVAESFFIKNYKANR